MTNAQVIERFIAGRKGKALHLDTDGRYLSSEDVLIAEHVPAFATSAWHIVFYDFAWRYRNSMVNTATRRNHSAALQAAITTLPRYRMGIDNREDWRYRDDVIQGAAGYPNGPWSGTRIEL